MGKEIYEKVNIVGTENVLAQCVAHGVPKLVFTSSAGVVYDGEEQVMDVDERLDFPVTPMDAYNETKARAEALVLAANGKDGLLTCALRPAGIFGYVHWLATFDGLPESDTDKPRVSRPGDRQVMSGLVSVLKNNQTKFQIGDNQNLFDWTYVENVAHAHILAADRLETAVPMEAFDEPL